MFVGFLCSFRSLSDDIHHVSASFYIILRLKSRKTLTSQLDTFYFIDSTVSFYCWEIATWLIMQNK